MTATLDGQAVGRTAFSGQELRQAAGCFALVLEAVPARVAGAITAALRIPTIGIGAGPDCDGQVLVWHDLLGINEHQMPRFVKQYAHVAAEVRAGLEQFVAEVRSGAFPTDEHAYKISAEELRLFESEIAPGVLAGDDWL